MISSSLLLNKFDIPLFTQTLGFLTPKEWIIFAQCSSRCKNASDADILWKFAAEFFFHLDVKSINVQSEWKFFLSHLFRHHPPKSFKSSYLLSPTSKPQSQSIQPHPQQQHQQRAQKNNILGRWRKTIGNLAISNDADNNNNHTNNPYVSKSLFEADLATIAQREQHSMTMALTAKRRQKQHLQHPYSSSSVGGHPKNPSQNTTSVVTFVVSKRSNTLDRAAMSTIDAHIIEALGCEGMTSEIHFDEEEQVQKSNDTNNSNGNSSLCELFLFDLFPCFDDYYHCGGEVSSNSCQVFMLLVIDDDVAERALMREQRNENNVANGDDDNNPPPPLTQQQQREPRQQVNDGDLMMTLLHRRSTAIDTLQNMMELIYNVSNSVSIFLPPSLSSSALPVINQVPVCSFLEALLHVAAADQCVPEWTVPNHFAMTLFIFSSANNNNNNTAQIPRAEIISDREWKDFVRDRLGINFPAASSVSLFFATRSREAFFGSDFDSVLALASRMTAAAAATTSSYSARTTINNNNFHHHNHHDHFYISWNIAPGLLTSSPAFSPSSNTFSKNSKTNNNDNNNSSSFLDIGFSPSLHEYLLFLASAVNQNSSNNNNNNNNNPSASATQMNKWWSPQLVMSFIQPQMKKIMATFERHMQEDETVIDIADSTVCNNNKNESSSSSVPSMAENIKNKIFPLTFSNLLKHQKHLQKDDDDGNDNGDELLQEMTSKSNTANLPKKNSENVKLIPDLDAHRALIAMSDASESASSSHHNRNRNNNNNNNNANRRTPTTTISLNRSQNRPPNNNSDENANNNNNVEGNEGGDDDEDEEDSMFEFGENEDDIVAQRILAAFGAADEGDDETARLILNGVIPPPVQSANAVAMTPEVAQTNNSVDAEDEEEPNGVVRQFPSTTPTTAVVTQNSVHQLRGLPHSSNTNNTSSSSISGQNNNNNNHNDYLERVHGRCSALPAESPQSARVPQHTSEFWLVHSRHAKAALEIALEIARPYCTTRNFSLLVADVIRNQIEDVTRKAWNSFAEHSEEYCTELIEKTVFKHFRANYGSINVSEYRKEKNALKKWFSSAHEKIEEYLLKSRGPRRLHVLQRFVSEVLVPEFVAACEFDYEKQEGELNSRRSSSSSTSSIPQHHQHEHGFQNQSNNSNNNNNNINSKAAASSPTPNVMLTLIHPEDARQAGTHLIREVDGMILRCEEPMMSSDPRRMEFIKMAKSIALKVGEEVDAFVNEHIMDAATESSLFDRRLTMRLHSISPAVLGGGNNSSSNQQQNVNNNNNNGNGSNGVQQQQQQPRNGNNDQHQDPEQPLHLQFARQQQQDQQQQQQQVVVVADTNNNNQRSLFRSAVSFFSNMLQN